MLQPVEEMIFNSNSTERYKHIFRHETELKWIISLQTPFPLGFNDKMYHQGNFSKMPDFDLYSLLDIRRHNRRSRGKNKNGNLKRKHKNNIVFDTYRFMVDPKIWTSSNAFEFFFT